MLLLGHRHGVPRDPVPRLGQSSHKQPNEAATRCRRDLLYAGRNSSASHCNKECLSQSLSLMPPTLALNPIPIPEDGSSPLTLALTLTLAPTLTLTLTVKHEDFF